MELELEIFGSLCATSSFVINGIRADSGDFGDQSDRDQENAEDYACGNMTFSRTDSTPEVLAKYRITESEYAHIAEQLESKLSFGCCGWCV